MRLLLLTSLILGLFLPMPALLLAQEVDTGVIRLAFTANIFSKADRNDASSALKAWASAVVKERNIQDRVEISMMDTIEELGKKLAAEEVDGATMATDELLALDIVPELVYVPIVNDRPEVNYIVLVNKKGLLTLDELRSGKVAVFENQRMRLARMWFINLLNEASGLSHNESGNFVFLSEEKVSNAIFKVFFRQIDAAIVTADAFQLAVELNPQIGNELQILRQSEPLVPGIFIFRSTWKGRTRNVLDDALGRLHTTPGGQQVLTVFQSSRMEKLPAGTIMPTLDLVKKWQQDLR